jgi:hypothetical protein
MSLLKTQFAITNIDHTAYAYFDMGHLRFDEKVPRRSGVAKTKEQAAGMIDRYREKTSSEWQMPLAIVKITVEAVDNYSE